ncbi:MAG: helix-turn-helix transcriptional regulator, partial [Candidatus Bathyarchaeia archaeon]
DLILFSKCLNRENLFYFKRRKVKIDTKTVLLILLFVVILFFGAEVVLCQFELEETRQFLIEVDADGSAVCTFKRVFLLKTEDDEAVFEQYLQGFDDRKQMLRERFSNETYYMVNRASDNTNRSMTTGGFNVSAYLLQTVTGLTGIIEYVFIWDGFALIDEGRIQIGDVFEIGLVLLENDELNVQYPEGYEATNIDPPPDLVMQERRLMWMGPRYFVAGTPAITLTRVSGLPSGLQIFAIAIVATLGIGSFVFFFRRFKKKGKYEETSKPTPLAILESESDEEEKIVSLLQMKGGYLRQSAIVEEFGYSKSKVSQILSDMEKKGLIERRKKGREKLVILKQQNDKL